MCVAPTQHSIGQGPVRVAPMQQLTQLSIGQGPVCVAPMQQPTQRSIRKRGVRVALTQQPMQSIMGTSLQLTRNACCQILRGSSSRVYGPNRQSS